MSEKKELIKKLEAIWILHNKALSIKQKMEDFVPEDHYERKVEVPEFPLRVNNEYDEGVLKILVDDVEHTADDAMEHMSKCYDTAYHPKKPVEPVEKKRPEPEKALTNEYKQKKGCLPLVAGFVAACSLLSGSLFYGDIATKIINIVIIAVCVVVILLFHRKKRELEAADQEAHKRAVDNYELEAKVEKEKYEQDLKEYQSLVNSHKLAKADFLEEYAKWREVYLESLEEESEIEDKLEADRVAAVEKINDEEFVPILNELSELNDLVTTNYLPALDVIIDLLKSGRADDLKEAINLYEDMLYRERQLQLQREQEEQRRYEEEQRRADEERRYQEEMRFREEQERQRQREEERREREAERRHREELKQREQQERDRAIAERERIRKEEYKEHMNRIDQEKKQRSAGQAQCFACLNAGRCNMQVHNNAPNCTGFRPR